MSVYVVRARRGVPMTGETPSRGAALYAPLHVVDDMCLVYASAGVDDAAASGAAGGVMPRAGRLVYAGKYAPAAIPAGVHVHDLGDVTLAPAAVNAHTHLQLAHIQGNMCWGQGFAAWLKGLIPLLSLPFDAAAISDSVAQMHACGTAYAADFTGAGIPLVARALYAHGVGGTLLAEWFGFAPTEGAVWPPFVDAAVHTADASCCSTLPSGGRICASLCDDAATVPLVSSPAPCSPYAAPHHADGSAEFAAGEALRAAPAGHALYSTALPTVQAAHAWCQAQGRPFALHLAESPEEDMALTEGRGPLVEIYAARVLPQGWRAPGMRPVPLAARLGLLGAGTLAVHGVQCRAEDISLLASTGTAVCLCPRSNAILAVGRAPVRALVEGGVLLCLGTDGLTSNTDLDVRQEACALLGDLPATVLLRLLCVNGWAALRLPYSGGLRAGAAARWMVVPEPLSRALSFV